MINLRLTSTVSCLGLVFTAAFAAPISSSKPARPAAPVVSWVVQTSGTTASLRGISAVNDQTAWASGTKGTVLRTVDGGLTWTVMIVPGAETSDLRDIEAFSADSAVVMGIGRPAKIFRTVDGGKTWTETYTNDSPGIFLDGFAFYDEKNGLAVGDPMDGRFFLISTTDGGTSWTPLPMESRPLALEGEAAFAASGTSLAVQGKNRAWLSTGGPVSRVWRSEDRGRHWEAVPSSLLEGSSTTGGFSVVFLDEKSGITVGGDYKVESAAAGNAAVSRDGGKTWTPVKNKQPGGFREAVAFAPGTSPLMTVAVGPSGSDYSLDLGKTWTPIISPTGFHAVSFAKKGQAGWAVGRNGTIAKFDGR